jgi:hypothetical protein
VIAGHSLGGGLTQLMVEKLREEKQLAVGVTFNAPGVSHVGNKTLPIYNVIMDGDLINAVNSKEVIPAEAVSGLRMVPLPQTQVASRILGGLKLLNLALGTQNLGEVTVIKHHAMPGQTQQFYNPISIHNLLIDRSGPKGDLTFMNDLQNTALFQRSIWTLPNFDLSPQS